MSAKSECWLSCVMPFVHAHIHTRVLALPWAMWHWGQTHTFTYPWVHAGLSGCLTNQLIVSSWSISPGLLEAQLQFRSQDKEHRWSWSLKRDSRLSQSLLLSRHPSLSHPLGIRGLELEPSPCQVLTDGRQPPWASVSTCVKVETEITPLRSYYKD